MKPIKKPSKNMQKNGRVMRRREKTLRAQPIQTLDDGNLFMINNQGVRFTISPDQFSGKTTGGGSPLVYRSSSPEIVARQNSDRQISKMLNYVRRMEEYDKGGREGERPFRFEYMMRPRRPETPELDKTLRPMTAVKEKEGRKPELIMRANDKMKSGQEPNYYKFWDEKRKQWSTRPVEPEELDRYRQDNRVFRTPSIRF